MESTFHGEEHEPTTGEKVTTDEIMELLEPVRLSGKFAEMNEETPRIVKLSDLKHGEFSASTEVNGRKVPKRYVDLEAELCGAATESFAVGSDDWAIFVRFHMVAVAFDAMNEAFDKMNAYRRPEYQGWMNLARAIHYELEISEDI